MISASGQSAYLIDGSGASVDLVIPSEVAGTAVKAIAREAFAGNLALTSVTVPDGVQGIQIDTFRDCSSLESVTLPDSLKHIGGSAFEN